MSDQLYWAATPDPDQLWAKLKKRRDRYHTFLERKGVISSIYKLWRFNEGLFYDYVGGNVVPGGEHGDISQIGVNKFHSRLNLLHTYATSQEADWDAQAVDGTPDAIEAARKANRRLDWAMDAPEYRVEEKLKRSAWHALILQVGYFLTLYDEKGGKELDGDPETLDMNYTGSIRLSTPTIFDVFFDTAVAEPRDRTWFGVREYHPRHDTADLYYSMRDHILNCGIRESEDTSRERFYGMDRAMSGLDDLEDMIEKTTFIHLPTPAMKKGKLACFVGGKALYVQDLPTYYKRLPLHRMVHTDKLLNSTVGRSPAVDLAPLQEAYNIDISTILTNHRKFGQSKIWSKLGEDLVVKDFEPDTNWLQSYTPPEIVNLCQTSPELLNFPKDLDAMIDDVTGVAQVSRGQIDRETSGLAAALLDSKTIQANSGFDGNYRMLMQDVGQTLLDIWREKERGPAQSVPMAADLGGVEMVPFSGEELDMVGPLLVKAGSAATRTTAGKLNLAQMIVQIPGVVKNEKDLIALVEGAPLSKLTDIEDKQRQLIADENQQLKKGMKIIGTTGDDHLGHFKSHVGEVLGSIEARKFSPPQVVLQTLAHSGWHLGLLAKNPLVQAAMVAMGWCTAEQIAAFQMLGAQIDPKMIEQLQTEADAAGPVKPQASAPGPSPGSPEQILSDAKGHLETEAAKSNALQGAAA